MSRVAKSLRHGDCGSWPQSLGLPCRDVALLSGLFLVWPLDLGYGRFNVRFFVRIRVTHVQNSFFAVIIAVMTFITLADHTSKRILHEIDWGEAMAIKCFQQPEVMSDRPWTKTRTQAGGGDRGAAVAANFGRCLARRWSWNADTVSLVGNAGISRGLSAGAAASVRPSQCPLAAGNWGWDKDGVFWRSVPPLAALKHQERWNLRALVWRIVKDGEARRAFPCYAVRVKAQL